MKVNFEKEFGMTDQEIMEYLVYMHAMEGFLMERLGENTFFELLLEFAKSEVEKVCKYMGVDSEEIKADMDREIRKLSKERKNEKANEEMDDA